MKNPTEQMKKQTEQMKKAKNCSHRKKNIQFKNISTYQGVYFYMCHVISHGDDKNKINTILPLEWTVATRQKSDR